MEGRCTASLLKLNLVCHFTESSIWIQELESRYQVILCYILVFSTLLILNLSNFQFLGQALCDVNK